MPKTQPAVETRAPEVDISRAANLVPHVRLATTRLLELHCAFAPMREIPAPPYEFATEVGIAWARRDDGFGFAVKVDVRVGAVGGANDPFWTCTAAQDLTYLVEDTGRFSDEDAIAFGMTSAVVAAWPYLREAVQNSSARAGLNPVVLDVIRVMPPSPSPAFSSGQGVKA